MKEIDTYMEETNDANVLDRVVSLLSQASSALKTVCDKR